MPALGVAAALAHLRGVECHGAASTGV